MSLPVPEGGYPPPDPDFPDVPADIVEAAIHRLRQIHAIPPRDWPETLAEQEDALNGFGPCLYAFLLARGVHPANDETKLIRYGANVTGLYRPEETTYLWAGRYLALEQATFGLLDDKPDDPERNTCTIMVPIASPFIRTPGILTYAVIVEGGIKEEVGVINYPDDPFTQRAFFRVAHALAGAVITAYETDPPISLDRMPPWPSPGAIDM